MLKTIMCERGYTLQTLAKELGVSEKSLKDKLEGRSEFKVGEVLRITLLLQLSYNEIYVIFFK